MAQSWWNDVSVASKKGQQHRVGKIILYRDRNTDPKLKQMLIIDGQQRCTTTQILLTSIRDALWNMLSEVQDLKVVAKKVFDLIGSIHEYLFIDKAEGMTWMMKTIEQIASG